MEAKGDGCNAGSHTCNKKIGPGQSWGIVLDKIPGFTGG